MFTGTDKSTAYTWLILLYLQHLYTLYTCILYTVYCTLYNVYCILHTLYTLYARVYLTLYSVPSCIKFDSPPDFRHLSVQCNLGSYQGRGVLLLWMARGMITQFVGEIGRTKPSTKTEVKAKISRLVSGGNL